MGKVTHNVKTAEFSAVLRFLQRPDLELGGEDKSQLTATLSRIYNIIIILVRTGIHKWH